MEISLKLYLALNSFAYKMCKVLKVPTDHPFNSGEGVKRLNYASFEYESADRVFSLFDNFVDWRSFLNAKDVLDVACGAGGKSVWMREHGAAKVVGLDMMPIFIEQAKSFAESKSLSDIHFLLGDSASMSIEDESIDLVVLNDAMEHVGQPEKTLREVMRVLRPGGRALINFEPYYHPRGGHLSDTVMIPWEHVFFSEMTRIKAYKKLVKAFDDGDDRIDFRISKREDGREYFSYINGMTLAWFRRIIKNLEKDGLLQKAELKLLPFNRPLFRYLVRIPFLREFFTKNTLCYLQKA